MALKLDYGALAAELEALLGLAVSPVAITFTHGTEPPPGVPRHAGVMPPEAADGRRGRVAASCVFWFEAAVRSFTTVPDDHGNCSVGSLTHGLKTMDELGGKADVAALLESGWVSVDDIAGLPAVSGRPKFVTYGPLGDARSEPDVVFLRLDAKQVMMLHEAEPGLHFEGKPQCHIIPMARESETIAVSVGCTLSRLRTGMADHELTCALPATRLPELVAALRRLREANTAAAEFADQDMKRFGPNNRVPSR